MSKKNISSPFAHSSQARLSRHHSKKNKRYSDIKDNKNLLPYISTPDYQPLSSVYKTLLNSMPGHYKLGIWRKNMNLLTRIHLPSYVKVLQYFEGSESLLIPSKANINPKKTNKSDILIEDPLTQKTRLIKMQSFPILLTPHKLIFFRISQSQFQQIFESETYTKQEVKKVYQFLRKQLLSFQEKYLVWPAVVMEGLNYKMENIQDIVNNFQIKNTDSANCFEKLIKTMNEVSLANQTQSNIQAQVNQGIDGQSKMLNENKKLGQQEAFMEIEQQQIEEQREQGIQNQLSLQPETEQKLCIWLIGTSYFSFSRTNILSWNFYEEEKIKQLFSTTCFSSLVKQANQIIQSLNKHTKLQESQIKADQTKYFLYRMGVEKSNEEVTNICIPLRFENSKTSGKRILIKVIKKQSTELKWVPSQSVFVNYTLPIITRKEMNFMYFSKKMPPLDIVTTLFYRQFLFLHHTTVAEISRILFPQFYTSQQQAYRQRCTKCNYVIRDMAFKCCFFCHTFCHDQCCAQSRKKPTHPFLCQLFQENNENPSWICQKCQPCFVCSEGVSQDNLFCSQCYSYFHIQCGRMKGNENQQKMENLKTSDKYICEFCLKCKMCSHKLKDNQYVIIDNQYYCSQCTQKIKSNNHCHVCMKKKEGNSAIKWIQCGDNQCFKWVHQTCDLEYIEIFKNPSLSDPYLCPLCRQVEKRKIFSQIINNLSIFDEAQFFTQPSYKSIPFYDTIISQPMCFSVMKEKALNGEYDDNPYKKINSNFNLIVNNALKFNMPKDTAHIQAKILKILGQFALQRYRPLFNPQLRSLLTRSIFDDLVNTKLSIHRQINNHYPEILLNYGAQKSFVEVRELRKKINEVTPQQQMKFSSQLILNNFFRNSTIIFRLKKQKIGISNLFTMPKSESQRGIWHPIKGDLCYYHDNTDIIFSCDECCQSYCCMKQCIRHRTCSVCNQKGCKCDKYECGCIPLKQKQKKLIQNKLIQKYSQPYRSYKENLMNITQNFKYCLKCSQDRILTRICSFCEGLCSWGYFRCPDCSRVWHKKCYPFPVCSSFVSNYRPFIQLPPQSDMNVLSSNQNFNITNRPQSKQNSSSTCQITYCKQCLSSRYPNNYQQALTLQSKSRLIKITKITRYMRIFIQIYFYQGIRLTPSEIQSLIYTNYDQFSVREQFFKQYELNYSIIQRFRQYTFKTNAAIERSCSEFLNDYVEVQKFALVHDFVNGIGTRQICEEKEKNINLIYQEAYMIRCKEIWWKYFRFANVQQQQWKLIQRWQDSPSLMSSNAFLLYGEDISQMRRKTIEQLYTYKDYNSTIRLNIKLKNNLIMLQQQIQKGNGQMEQQNVEKQVENFPQSFISKKEYRSYLQSLLYVSSVDESFLKSQHRYRYTLIYHPRSMPYEYKLNPTFKKKYVVESEVRSFLLGIYEQNKYCLRKGSTCILKENKSQKDGKDSWRILKKWGKMKEILISLQKRNQKWFLRIDQGYQRVVFEIEDIIEEINKKLPSVKITSFKELGQFLGFTILEPFYRATHFTNFLQTNLVDEMPLLEKKNRISQLFSSFTWGQNGIFSKSGSATPTTNIPLESIYSQKIISYDYCMNKSKPPYLSKKKKKSALPPKALEKKISNADFQLQNSASSQLESQIQTRKQSFITFEDLKRFLIDYSLPNPVKLDISIKNSSILNQVFIAPSKIHKLGLFSRKFIKKHSIVIEYVGQIVSESVADLRQKKFHYGCYLFGILKENQKDIQDKKDIIDATFRGNMARYLNHSCDPNCKAKTEYINGSPRIIIYTIRDIQQFQEITYDYQFNVDAVEKLECTCGAKNCQGRLN